MCLGTLTRIDLSVYAHVSMPVERSLQRWRGRGSSNATDYSTRQGQQPPPPPPPLAAAAAAAATSAGSNGRSQQNTINSTSTSTININNNRNSRWGSNLSVQRRERTVVWASCLQKVQELRQGGSWGASSEVRDQRPEGRGKWSSGAARSGTATATTSASLVGGGDTGASLNGVAGDSAVVAERAKEEARIAEEQLGEQLDLLSRLTYPNSSIR